MNVLRLRTVALAAIAVVAISAAGCGGDDQQQAQQKQDNEQVTKASNAVTQNAKADPATQKAQRELAEKAKKQKAEAIAEARKIPEEGRANLKCDRYGLADDVRPTGHTCADAFALIKAGGEDWVALPTADPKKIHGYKCIQSDANSKRIKVRCYDISGQITFSVPTS